MQFCAAVDKYSSLSCSSSFLYSNPYHTSPRHTIGLAHCYFSRDKVGRRGSCTAPQAHQDCPLTGCRQVWFMSSTFINISSRDLNTMVYRQANLYFFLPWRPVAVDKFCEMQTSFTDDNIHTASITLLKTLWSISIIALFLICGLSYRTCWFAV